MMTGPSAPKAAVLLFEDKVRGGLWLGGVAQGGEGLTYFDGTRFISPFTRLFPKAVVSGMAEDHAGGIWLATTAGVYRAFQGRLNRVADGLALRGIVQAAPDVFLATVTKPATNNTELLRVANMKGKWQVDVVVPSTPEIRFQVDRLGNVLYPCLGGYCELRGQDAVNWHMGAALPVTRHNSPVLPLSDREDSVYRDRFGCVWIRSSHQIAYRCPGDKQWVAPQGIADWGSTQISELDDGSIVIPSYAKLAVGRPGHFRVITALNGNPGTINAIATKDGSIWLGVNGLFVFPTRLRMENWTQRDGLDGNTWSILRTSSRTLAIAGEELRVLTQDRSRWSLAPAGPGLELLFAGPKGTAIASTLTRGTVQLSSEGKIIGKVDAPHEVVSRAGVHADPHGGLWTCSDDGRLLHKAARWEPVSIDEASVKKTCVFLAVDSKGGAWYGDWNWRGAGFALVEEPSGIHPQVRRFPDGGEVGNATVRFLGVDSRGWIWRGSPVGVYVADPEQARQGQWLYLNRLDGIAGIDANRTSFFSDPDGSVWFGLDDSINHLYPPADFLHPSYTPSIFISGFSWNGGEFQMADMVSSIDNRATLTAHIGSLQFDRRNALCLRYRLLPEQSKWIETKSLDLPLGVLSSGFYDLEVQARLFTGPWSHTVQRSFSVLPPIWLTAPYFIAYSLLSILLFASVYFLRRRQSEEDSLMPDLGSWRLGALMPESHDLIGSTLDGRYQVGDLLARGGFASVMSGYDLTEKRPCAIKIFRSEVKNKTSIVRGFEQEVAALRQIHHPNVVSIYADGLTPSGAPFLAMEFVTGKNLRDILEQGPLPGPRAARLLDQLAHALDAIHERGICHRDLKPENVIVRHNDSHNEEAVLIDFSIAIIKDANETLHGISRAAGTFDYMAPEQALGHAQPASDIFSLAKVVIEMLTGQRVSLLLPNAALDLPAQTAALLARFNLNLSEQSIQMLAAALQFDPAKRPNVAGDFARPLVSDLHL
jgi:ligand-binding sensor domain-containing protein/predicted Ser/Thr protein kinase